MSEEKQAEMVLVSAEVIDTFDDQSIVEMMTGQTIQDYVYSFKQGSRMVEGLILAGINEAAIVISYEFSLTDTFVAIYFQ